MPHFLFVLANHQTLAVTIDHEPGGAFWCQGIETKHPGHVSVGDPHLGPVEFVILVHTIVTLAAYLGKIIKPHPLVVAPIIPILDLCRVDRTGIDQEFVLAIEHERVGALICSGERHALQGCPGLKPAGIAAGARLGECKGADLACRNQSQEQFVGRGAPVQFSHDLLRGRAYLVKGWETRLQLGFETGQVSAQSRATGIHEMLEKRTGHRPQHWFAADILLDAFAEFHERTFDPHGLWRSKQAQQMLDIRFAFLELAGLGEKGFQVLFCPREILLQAQQNGCGPNAGMRHDRQRIRRVSIPHRERAENVVIRFETSFTAVLDRDVHSGKPRD